MGHSKVDERNLFEELCLTQRSVGLYKSKHNCIREVIQADSNNTTKQICEIVHLLLKKTMKLLTPKCFKYALSIGNYDLIGVMLEYDETEGENICYICMSGALPQEQFINICKCKIPIHRICLKKLLKTNGKICKTCRTQFRLNEIRIKYGKNKETSIFSPFDDFYPAMTANGRYISCRDMQLMDKLYLAVCYLQLDRIISILDVLSKEKFHKYIMDILERKEDNIFSMIELKDGKINKLELKDSFPSGYGLNGNKEVMGTINICMNNKLK
jgi:hypothetical protein